MRLLRLRKKRSLIWRKWSRRRYWQFRFGALRIFTNVEGWWLLVATSQGLFITLSIGFSDWTWWARSGAIMVLAGLLLAARQQIRVRLSDPMLQLGLRVAEMGDVNRLLYPGSEEWVDDRAAFKGLIMAVVGTLIWAFGDLVGLALK